MFRFLMVVHVWSWPRIYFLKLFLCTFTNEPETLKMNMMKVADNLSFSRRFLVIQRDIVILKT